MATAMFFIDLGLFVRNRGLPFKKDGKPEPSNGGPARVEAGALETAKLNTPANETD